MDANQILSLVKIQDLISEHVKLEYKNDDNLKGLCPFHSDNNPSFLVNTGEGFYKCFGCGKGGNAINFIMDIYNISYLDAINVIAHKLGFEIEQFDVQILKTINEYFKAKFPLITEYLNQRKLSVELCKELGFGYGGSPFELTNEFHNMLPSLTELGIVKTKNEGTPGEFSINLLNRRMTIPISTHIGLVAFSGRALEPGIEKYLNTQDNKFYSKQSTVFNLNRASKSIKEEDLVIITEGFFDVIRMNMHGYQNVVSTMGVSPFLSHIKKLAHLTSNALIMYDRDEAGIKAIKKVALLLLRNSMRFQVGFLPTGEDPDSYLREGGKLGDIEIRPGEEILTQLFTRDEVISFIQSLDTQIDLPRELIYHFRIDPEKFFSKPSLITHNNQRSRVKNSLDKELALFIEAFPSFISFLNEDELDRIQESKFSEDFFELSGRNYFKSVKDPHNTLTLLRRKIYG